MSMSLNELRSECLNCKNCKLCETRTNVVFGTGNPDSKILFIGEGPGENEDLQGLPFVGRGGMLLDKMLSVVDLSREKNIYIANMVKCRPPKNRDPEESEVAACRPWLEKQIEIIDPKIIVCLGRVSAIRFIDPNFKVTKEHGQFIEKDGRLVMGTFHPAAILRNPNQKPAAMDDFFALQAKIEELCPETYAK
ncbi:MAG: uracil-DNA glycosylase [Oscillospiraceae bacterium]|nr:uracil-DNA glycosylase [Oscillospiraceae bacterium]